MLFYFRSFEYLAVAERVPRQEDDAQSLAGFQHVFRIAIAQVVAVLHRDDARHLARALELIDVEVGNADVADLAFALHVGERAERNLERYLRIDRMELIEIDALQPQALQAAFQILFEFFGSAVGVPAAGAWSRYAAFAADDQAFRIGMQGFGDQDLAGMGAVAFGGVEEVDAELCRAPQHPERLCAVAGLAPDAAIVDDAHRAESDAIDAQLTELHRPVRAASQQARASRAPCVRSRAFPAYRWADGNEDNGKTRCRSP